MYLNDDIRSDIKDALETGNGMVFGKVNCPRCGKPAGAMSSENIDSKETGTSSGGFMIRFVYTCGHPDTAIIYADDGNNIVSGRAETCFCLPK